MHFGNLVQQLCVYIITWNVNSQLPNSKIQLNNLLGIENDFNNNNNNNNYEGEHNQQQLNGTCKIPDLYVIGLQEVNSNPTNLIKNLFQDDIWISKFRYTLLGSLSSSSQLNSNDDDFILIKTERMQGLLIFVLIKRKHLLHINQIESDKTRTGFGGLWGNKGAISIRMNIYGNTITFINSHLPAHDEQLNKRINDYHYIIKNHHHHIKNSRSIIDHDYIFWFGDLNFRLIIDNNLDSKTIRNLIKNNNNNNDKELNDLFERDQLNLIRNENLAFDGFNEDKPKFSPTYKFHLNSQEYNIQRRPAWTDRILYRLKNNYDSDFKLNIKQLQYKSYPEYEISDHKPVIGKFIINLADDNNNQKIIKFENIPIWKMNDDNIIEYIIPDGYDELDGDWIGIYPKDFNSLTNYETYVYTSHSIKHDNKRYLRVQFSDNINLIENKDYVLLYFQSSDIRTIYGVVGISNVFQVEK